MFQHEANGELRICPSCGRELSIENEVLRCPEHGAFFSYGPHLLVRAPEADIQRPQTVLPWEKPTPKRST